VVAGFAPIGDEIDVLPLLSTLSADGHPCALPVVVGRGAPLAFRAWTPGMALIEAQFGVGVPPASSPEVRPSVVLVPLLAFDGAGQRIGYGAGFYDRTLQALRRDGEVLAIGIAYADQQIESVPVDGNDARLDLVVTERFVINTRTGS
jgi:5-formyltetrahydrofolate cyclo-ligase